jgi:hypothetical protein
VRTSLALYRHCCSIPTAWRPGGGAQDVGLGLGGRQRPWLRRRSSWPGATARGGAAAAGAPEPRHRDPHGGSAGVNQDRFRLAAISSFAFVEAAGPTYAGKLPRDALRLPQRDGGPSPRRGPAWPLAARVEAAEAVLWAKPLCERAPVRDLQGSTRGT